MKEPGHYRWMLLVALGALSIYAQNPKTEFDIDGSSHVKRIGTTTKEQSNTPFTLVTPVPEQQKNNFDVEAQVEFTSGTATGNATLLDSEMQGMNWIEAGPFVCLNRHTFSGKIELPSDFESKSPYTWRSKLFGEPCGEGGPPDHWYIHGLQYMLHVDLDVDSNNNGSIQADSREEDDMENQTGLPGKIFGVNDADVNTNGVPDVLELSATRSFTPIELRLKTAVPLNDLVVRFLYDGAPPQTTNGALRLWKKDGAVARSTSDYITPDTNANWSAAYKPASLGFTSSGQALTFYMEGVKPGAQDITVELAYSNVTQTVNQQNRNQRQPETALDTVRVTLIKVEILRDESYLTDAALNVFVGERINLEGKVEPAGMTVESVRWEIPGQRIKGWSANANQSTLAELETADLSGCKISYYWVDGGGNHEVTYHATISGVATEKKATFNVLKPNPSVWGNTGSIGIRNFGFYGVHYGSWSTPGIRFNRGAFGCSGDGCWIQLADTIRRIQDNDGDWWRWSGAGIDTKFPYSDCEMTTDSPGQELPSGDRQAIVNDSFQTYLMFRPKTPDAIWVPIMKVVWGWSATASKTGTNWVMDTSYKTQPVVSTTTEHPSWSRNTTNNIWVKE